MTKVVTFGETMVQYNASYVGPFRDDGDYLEDCAGTESNFAADLTRLGIPGVETVWVSRLGDDRRRCLHTGRAGWENPGLRAQMPRREDRPLLLELR